MSSFRRRMSSFHQQLDFFGLAPFKDSTSTNSNSISSSPSMAVGQGHHHQQNGSAPGGGDASSARHVGSNSPGWTGSVRKFKLGWASGSQKDGYHGAGMEMDDSSNTSTPRARSPSSIYQQTSHGATGMVGSGGEEDDNEPLEPPRSPLGSLFRQRNRSFSSSSRPSRLRQSTSASRDSELSSHSGSNRTGTTFVPSQAPSLPQFDFAGSASSNQGTGARVNGGGEVGGDTARKDGTVTPTQSRPNPPAGTAASYSKPSRQPSQKQHPYYNNNNQKRPSTSGVANSSKKSASFMDLSDAPKISLPASFGLDDSSFWSSPLDQEILSVSKPDRLGTSGLDTPTGNNNAIRKVSSSPVLPNEKDQGQLLPSPQFVSSSSPDPNSSPSQETSKVTPAEEGPPPPPPSNPTSTPTKEESSLGGPLGLPLPNPKSTPAASTTSASTPPSFTTSPSGGIASKNSNVPSPPGSPSSSRQQRSSSTNNTQRAFQRALSIPSSLANLNVGPKDKEKPRSTSKRREGNGSAPESEMGRKKNDNETSSVRGYKKSFTISSVFGRGGAGDKDGGRNRGVSDVSMKEMEDKKK